MSQMQLQIFEPIEQPSLIEGEKNINVCAYCRVSTDEFDQRNSLKSQKKFFDQYFKKHPNWNVVDVFADEGISGTSLEKRDEFNKMLTLAKNKKIDVILTKEVSRFSRNTKHTLNIVDELYELGVYVWFLSDNLYTGKIKDREILLDYSTSAEKESRRTSTRVKWGHQRQMERGVVFGRREMFGYNIVKDDFGIQRFEIIEEEADVIKKIFEWFAEGDGTHVIARRLESLGIKTKRYKNGWSNTVILRILRNEKYVGDLEQGKTFTPDPMDHKKKYNKGEYNRYYITDHHPESAIVSRELWDKVKALLKEKEPSDEVKATHSNRYWTSGKIFCGCCGGRYVSYNKKQKNSIYKAWVCFENHQRGHEKEITNELGETYKVGCNNKRVNDKVLKIAIKDILTEVILPNKQKLLEEFQKEIHSLNKKTDNSKQISALEKKISRLQGEIKTLTEKLISGIVSDYIYLSMKEEREKQILELSQKIADLQSGNDVALEKTTLKNKFEQFKKIIELSDKDFNEELFGRITKKIIVHPGNILELHLSFMTRPIFLRYRTEGKGEEYNAIFDVIEQDEIKKL